MRVENPSLLVGNTPLIRFKVEELPALRLWVKLEGQNPTGSVKDRACISIIHDAIESGRLKPGQTLLDASSGNMACALAYFGPIFGHPVTVVCGSKLTEDKAQFIEYFGAELVRHGDFTMDGNRYCREVLMKRDGDHYCFLDQLHNWANPAAAYRTMGPEIAAEFPNLTAVVGSLGSGGTITGTAQYLKENYSNVTVVAVEAAAGTKIPGTGAFIDGDYITPFIKKANESGLIDVRQMVELESALARTWQLNRQGIFVGHQTGGVVEAAIRVCAERGLTGDVVAISGDSGWKNMAYLSEKKTSRFDRHDMAAASR